MAGDAAGVEVEGPAALVVGRAAKANGDSIFHAMWFALGKLT